MTTRFPNPQDKSFVAIPLALAFAVLTVVLMVMPYVSHPILWNMTAIGALGIFGGGRLRLPFALALTLGARVVGDVLVHFINDSIPIVYGDTPFVYASLLAYVLVGRWLCQSDSLIKIPAAGLVGSLQYFFVTNLGVWLIGIDVNNLPYPKTWSGLTYCFTEALPFYRGTIAGDLAFTIAIFGLNVCLVYLLQPGKARSLS
jgi:hypothetical protein